MSNNIPSPPPSPTLCLNMIVKNESKIITRLLDSVVHLIDYYCICDTGSTDQTIETINQYFKHPSRKHIKGSVIQEPFKNFGYNRTYALQQARQTTNADYALLLDADMQLEIGAGVDSKGTVSFASIIGGLRNDGDIDPPPQYDLYYVLQGNENFNYYNLRIVRLKLDVICVGPTHEDYDVKNPGATRLDLPKSLLFIRDHGDGGCKDDKFERDIRLLSEALTTDPNNARYHFYLANSYFDLGRFQECLEPYIQCLKYSHWDEEQFYCQYRLGQAYLQLERDVDDTKAIYWLTMTYQTRPTRAEGLYELIKHYRIKGKARLAEIYYKIAKDIPYPKDDKLFIHCDVYQWRLDYEYSIFSYYLNQTSTSPSPSPSHDQTNRHRLHTAHHYLKLINRAPSDQFNHLIDNYRFSVPKLLTRKTINLSQTLKQTFNNVEHTFYSSSASIAALPTPTQTNYSLENTTEINDIKYLMNIRYVNYRILPNGRYQYLDDRIITINQRCYLNSQFEIVEQHLFNNIINDDGSNVGPSGSVNGIEDLKLQTDLTSTSTHTNMPSVTTPIYYTATIYSQGHTSCVYGKYLDRVNVNINDPITNNTLEYTQVARHQKYEKNWVFIPKDISDKTDKIDTNMTPTPPKVIYSWNPLKIGTFNGALLVLEEISHKQSELPPIFKQMRGSSNGCRFGDELWFVTHIVSHSDEKSIRRYYHHLVVFDLELNLLRYTIPFKFSESPIEYCLGLIVEHEQIIATYSVNDGATYLAVFTRDHLDNFWKEGRQ